MENKINQLLSGGGTAIPLFKVHMPMDVIAPVSRVLLSGYIGQGPKVEEFEKALAPRFGNLNVLTTNSCTSALQLALRLAGVGLGDSVISSPMTCSATNLPILAAGANIVWADINPRTGNIDPNDIDRKITWRTKAIMVVHWGGYPCDLDAIRSIAIDHKLEVIEDCAHAFGASYRGNPIGSHSDFCSFSFQAIKHLTTVDGGALTCHNDNSYECGKLLRWYGINRNGPRTDFRCEQDITLPGLKWHMNDVAATIGLEQLKHVDKVLAAHRDNARFYQEHLSDINGLTLLENEPDRLGSYWLFTIRVKRLHEFMTAMKQEGITVSQVHARNDKHTCFATSQCRLPGVDEFYAEQVNIPVGWWVTPEQRQHIVDSIRKFFS